MKLTVPPTSLTPALGTVDRLAEQRGQMHGFNTAGSARVFSNDVAALTVKGWSSTALMFTAMNPASYLVPGLVPYLRGVDNGVNEALKVGASSSLPV